MEGNMKNSKGYIEALNMAFDVAKKPTSKEYPTAAHIIFDAGIDFAMSQPKHIFDGVAQVGEVRRFEDELVDVVRFSLINGGCEKCVLHKFSENHICQYLTGCVTHNVKYIKR